MPDASKPGLDPRTPHRRQNLLSGEWVLVSPQREQRPWQGRVERPSPVAAAAYDPGCYLCPGNARAGGRSNPRYDGVYVFDNDFPALLPAAGPTEVRIGGMLHARAEPGVCRVVCFSPRHDLTLAEMDTAAIAAVVDAWTREYEELGGRPDIAWVQVFENRGELMGCSNPHPHGQIWAQATLPAEAAREQERQRRHYEQHDGTLLGDYLRLELELGERIVCENEGFVALVPFWAVWPFETLLLSREHRRSLSDFTRAERIQLADLLKRLTTRYDNLFETAFPYSAGIHQAPTDGAEHPEWHFHMHFYPPLLRSATVRKFMVGYEMLGEPQRDLTPETAAARLRALDETHYRARPT